MRAILTVSLLMLSSVAVRSLAEDGVYLEADSFSYSQTVPVRGYFNDWHTPFHDGERALTYNYAEAGVFLGDWEMGLVARYDEYLRFTPDTAELYYRTENHLPLDPGRRYAVNLNANQFAANGFRLGYNLTLQPSLKFGFGLSYLQGTSLTDGTLSGEAYAISTTDFNYNLAVDYAYSKDRLFKRPVDAPDGWGYSVDLSLEWQTGKLATRLHVIDVIGRLYWHNAPYTLATATSNTKSYDADGYLIINPTLSGYEGNNSYAQRLPTRAHLDIRYAVDDTLGVVADIYYTQIKTFTPVGLSYLHNGGRAEVQYGWQTGAVTLGYTTTHFKASITSDHINWQTARTIGLSLETRLGFD